MTEKETKGKDRVGELENQIQEALRELEEIRNSQLKIASPLELEATERKIVKATDKLASLLTGLKIQQAIDSDDLKEQEKQLIESLPEDMKNQGRRPVQIQTSRGESVTIEAPYFSRKKKKDRRKKRKKKNTERYLSLFHFLWHLQPLQSVDRIGNQLYGRNDEFF